MIPEIQTFIENKSSSPESFDSLNKLILEVNNRNVSILMIVEDLSDTLVSTDPKVRAKGIELLIRVFCSCNIDTITPKMASVILKFCLERLNDLHSLQYLLDGILYILNNLYANIEIIKEVPKAMIEELTIQGYQQTVRHVIFKCYETLVDKYLDVLKTIEDTFVPGFVQTVEGEKDPRNIMIIFKIIKIIVSELNYKPYVEDIFEIIFCYFPITFKAPPGNVIKITTEDLKNGLRECLVSVPELSKFAIPQLIEKLSSRLDNTKRDALDVLIAGGDVYNFEDYSSNLDKLTEILRDEAFDNAGEVLEEDYIKAITGFTKIFSRGGNEWIDKYVDQMTTKPISYIKDFGHPRGKFSRNIICAVIKENEYAFNKLINQVFPDLMTKIVQPNPPSVQSFLMEYVKNLLSIANLQNISEDHLIYQYKDTLYREFNKLKECDDDNDFKKSMEITSIGGLYELANLKGFLSDEQIKKIIGDYNNKLLQDPREEIRKLCLKNLLGISSKNSNLIISDTLPLLYSKLKEDMIDSNYEWILQSTEDITVECKFYEDTMNKLIDIYDKGIEEKKNKDYLTKLLESIKNIIERGIKIEDDKSLIISCFPLFKNNILRILIKNSINQREERPNVELISSIFQK
jgi:DNA repair/transcription protein MET18/MMS19